MKVPSTLLFNVAHGPFTPRDLYRVALWAAAHGYFGRTAIEMDEDEKLLTLTASVPTVEPTGLQDADVSRR